MIRTAGGVVSEQRFGGQGGGLTDSQWLWHYYNQLRDREEQNEAIASSMGGGASSGDGFSIENGGYAASLIEQGMSMESVAKIMKVSVDELTRQLNQSIPDAIDIDG